MKKNFFVILCILFSVIYISISTEIFPAERDKDYDRAFSGKSGWTGADGTYSIPLSDGRTIWLFGDTFIGEVDHSGKRSEKTVIINNSIAIQEGKDPSNIKFIYGGTEEKPESFFVPPDGKGFFWIYDAIPDKGDGKIIVFLPQIEISGEGIFGFKQTGNWTADVIIEGNKYSVKNYKKLPYFQEKSGEKPAIAFGASILVEKDWTYIYGTEDYEITKNLILARIESGSIPSETPWEFFTGTGWSKNLSDCKPVFKEVGNELSVHKNHDGRYILTTQKNGSGSDVEIIFGTSPAGPWDAPLAVWHIEESNDKIFSYNAKAHPELSDKEKGLLISYNVNAWNFDDLYLDSTIYRPRFIRVHLKSEE
ncbi:MAG: DUF5005 domain-containing protein [Candidatus Eremiobacterota bacterium]